MPSSTTTNDSSSIKTTSSNNSYTDSLLGLREQIMANASVLCPHIVATHTTTATPFQVITIATEESKRALLLFGDALSMKIAARGPLADSDETALQGLLQVTSEALGWYTETLLGEMQNAEEVAGGEIDYLMVEQGFHFAAEQRILGEI